jgi:polysaccharide pyruvyl transferase WcaK-like protein
LRIILDQGIFDMRNAGQNALLQIAVQRVMNLWPDASIGITTFAPHLLKVYFPNAYPVSPDGHHGWFKDQDRFNRIHNLLPRFIWRFLLKFRENVGYRYPALQPSSIRNKLNSIRAREQAPLTEVDLEKVEMAGEEINYKDVVGGADLFIATGSQYMTDIAKEAGLAVLGRLEAAIQQGIPTAMVGQGMGPIEDPELRTRSKLILPTVDLIFVRERLEAPNLLKSLGVDPSRVLITGDDAVELAYKARTSTLGNGIGVSLRVMPYTSVDQDDLKIIETVLKRAASEFGVELVSLPISMSVHERDDLFIQKLLTGYSKVWMSGSKFQTPLEIIKNTQRCRLVVTGTFHAAVFAMGQGIPAVCLAKSASYVNKLTGLVDIFDGCGEVVLLNDEHLQEKLTAAVHNAWYSAESVRPKLLKAAARQINMGYTAYQSLFDLVASKNQRHPIKQG